MTTDVAQDPTLDATTGAVRGPRSSIVLLAIHMAIIAGLPYLTRRGLDAPAGRFPDTESVLRLLVLPAAVSALVVVGTVLRTASAGRSLERRDDRLDARTSRSVGVAVALATLAAVSSVRGIADAGWSMSLAVAAWCLLVVGTEETIIRGVAVREGVRRGWSDRRLARSTSLLYVPLAFAHLVTAGEVGFPLVVVTALSGPALFLLLRNTGSLPIVICVRLAVTFGLVVGRFGPDPTRHVETTVVLAIVAAVAVAGIALARRLPDGDNGERSASLGKRIAVPAATVAFGAVALLALPVPSSGLDARAEPASSFDEAIERWDRIVAEEDAVGVFEPCRSELLHHGRPTEQVIVLFHGLTNCPEQYLDLGRTLFDSGANVVILRAPRHGLEEGSTTTRVGSVELVGQLTAHELRDYANGAVDLAAGLGEEVVVSGLSMGGVLALWTAQFRADVDRVVAVAPAVSIPVAPHFVTTAAINLFNRVPNFSLPGHSKLDHAYAGESTGALGAMFLLAQAIGNETSTPSATDELIVVLNPNDEQVDNDEVVDRFVNGWADDDAQIELVWLPDIGLPHDVIDEDQPDGNVDVVYPMLIPLILG